MARFTQIDPETASGKAGELLSKVKAHMGLVPNMTRAMVTSPAVLEGYLGLSGALGRGALPAQLREKIALAVAEANDCGYCLAAHTAIGGMVKIAPDEIIESRRGHSPDSKTQAGLQFALDLLASRGHVSDSALAKIRAAGFSDGEIGEIVAHVALNVLSNYFNSVAQTDVDFPAAPPL
jgi:uncharacterized peroxidase-related enzyme